MVEQVQQQVREPPPLHVAAHVPVLQDLVQVGVRHDDRVVLGATEALGALAGAGGVLVDVLRDRGGADEADRGDVGVGQERVDRLLDHGGALVSTRRCRGDDAVLPRNVGCDGLRRVRCRAGQVGDDEQRAVEAGPEVLGGLGGFAGLFDASLLTRMQRPVLATSTDGVGTKVAIAQAIDKHDTIGFDLVGMVVDDIVVCGAEPLFMTDYIACGKVVPERIAAIVSGIADACARAGVALVGGETAEHPGLLGPSEYDVAGAATGVVEHEHVIGPHLVAPGDVVLGLASSGLHSNGYSLVRRVVDAAGWALEDELDDLPGTLGEALLTPTRIYARPLLTLIERLRGDGPAAAGVHALSHVTGGGLAANLARVLPTGTLATVDRATWTPPRIFTLVGEAGGVPRWLQSMFLYECQWLLPPQLTDEGYADVLDDAGRQATLDALTTCARAVDDDVLYRYDATALSLESRLLLAALAGRDLPSWTPAVRDTDGTVHTHTDGPGSVSVGASASGRERPPRIEYPDYFGQRVLARVAAVVPAGTRRLLVDGSRRQVSVLRRYETVAERADRIRRRHARVRGIALPSREGEVRVWKSVVGPGGSAVRRVKRLAAILRRGSRRRKALRRSA